MGVFAAAGVGKSTLLAQIVEKTDAEIVVIALIGERGREVREFSRKFGAEASSGLWPSFRRPIARPWNV
jgi:type III secretion protein N (ATPase)